MLAVPGDCMSLMLSDHKTCAVIALDLSYICDALAGLATDLEVLPVPTINPGWCLHDLTVLVSVS